MTSLAAFPAMAHRRGNPSWGDPAALFMPRPPIVTEFENQMRRLKLDESNCAGSDELRRWCERNKNRSYVPEWLLEHWEISVDPNITS